MTGMPSRKFSAISCASRYCLGWTVRISLTAPAAVGALRKHGVRFGAYHIFLPALLKPAPRTLAAQLWALRNGGLDQRGLDEIAHLAGSGRTSIKVDREIAKGLQLDGSVGRQAGRTLFSVGLKQQF